jgi:hypothetical protein
MTEQQPNPFAPPTCNYCGSAITAHQKFQPGHCGSPGCLVAHIEAGQAKLRKNRAEDYAERQASVRDQATDAIKSAANQTNTSTDDVLVAVVPYQNEPILPLSEEARSAFETHLTQAAQAAFELDDDSHILDHYQQKLQPEPAIVDAGCAACQGFCCKRGGGDNHAFIDKQSIYYIRKSKPDLTEQDVIDHFLDALPEESVSGACIFQGAQGCTLTRDWRAGLCNTFLCHDLFALHDVTGGQLDKPVVIAGINDDETGSTGLYEYGEPFSPL